MTKHDIPRGTRKRGAKYMVDLNHNGTRKTATVASLADAIAKKAELTEALATGKEVAGPRANAAGWTLQLALEKALSQPDARKTAEYALIM